MYKCLLMLYVVSFLQHPVFLLVSLHAVQMFDLMVVGLAMG